MSLEGTLETIALPDVLALLSVTTKTGELRVESGESGGSVWLVDGRVAGYDVGRQKSPVDALFALLRLPDGSFKFHTSTEPLNSVEPLELTPLMEQAEERLSQWPGIAEVVPSLSSELGLEESIDDEVVLSPEQWRLIASIGSGRCVVDVLDARDLGEFDGCKAIKELVETGLVHVVSSAVEPEAVALFDDTEVVTDLAPVTEAPAPDYNDEHEHTAGWSDAELTGLSEVWNDDKGEAQSAPADEEVIEAGQPVNRGLLLKFLGSARS